MAFYNLARMKTATTGTGTMTLTTAVDGCLTFALAGVSNAEAVNYAVVTYDLITHRPTHTEVGVGTYTSSGTTISRDTVEKSTNSDAKITLTGLSEVYISPLASDFNGFGGGGMSFARVAKATAETVTNTSSALIDIDTEVSDPDSIITLSGGDILFTNAGQYFVSANINLYSTGGSPAFNGNIVVSFVWNGYDPEQVHTYATADGIINDDITMSSSFTMTAGAYLDIWVANNSGDSIDVWFNDITILRLS